MKPAWYGLVAGIAVAMLPLVQPAIAADCQLINPSFELAAPGQLFAHWNTFGTTLALGSLTAHGQRAAAIVGANSGGFQLSGVWQQLDASAGDVWRVQAYAGHLTAQPLTGAAEGIINVEWRNSAGDLISFETLTAITAASPTGVLQRYELTTGPAPAGTVTTRVVLGFLQTPQQEGGAAIFDQVVFENLSGTRLDDVQWLDFPGGKRIRFAGRQWRIKGPGFYGPGPNWFTTRDDHVFVDGDGYLQLNIQQFGPQWFSSEVTLEDSLGYGDYLFTTGTDFEPWADNVVLGLFIWQYAICYDAADVTNLYNEFDVEISRWNIPGNDLGQFVAQPASFSGNKSRFALPTTGPRRMTFAFRWLPNRIESRTWRGGQLAENVNDPFHTWNYVGPHIPRPEQPRVHLNLWTIGSAPNDGRQHTASIESFGFVPACADPTYGEGVACWESCLNGPDKSILGSCNPRDSDEDQDLDMRDIAQIR